MKYIIKVDTSCSLYSEQREYDTEEEVMETMRILLKNFILIDNIIIKKETK